MILEKILFEEQECDKILSLINDGDFIAEELKFRSRKRANIKCDKNNEQFLKKIISFFENTTKLKTKSENNEYIFFRYEKHDFFNLHSDLIENRAFGIELLLNDSFNGGDMVFDFLGKKTITKKKGNCVAYNTNLKYEITEVTDGQRDSIFLYVHDYNIDYGTIKTII